MVSQEQAQQFLMQAQSYQQQMQSIIAQKENLKMQQFEIAKTLEDLQKVNDKTVYKSSGMILIKSTKEDVKKELTEKKELISTRLQTLERSEKRIKEKIDELREKLAKSDQKSGGG
jgi:prefoldin beta subunit